MLSQPTYYPNPHPIEISATIKQGPKKRFYQHLERFTDKRYVEAVIQSYGYVLCGYFHVATDRPIAVCSNSIHVRCLVAKSQFRTPTVVH